LFQSGALPISGVRGIALDASGNVIFVGATGAADFSTTPGALIPQIQTPGAGFVAKLNPSGSALVYSTYLAGTDPDLTGVGTGGENSANAVAVSASGNAYITGLTGSRTFPISTVTLDPTCGSEGTCSPVFSDVFVTELDASGALLFSTYLGGSFQDVGKGIAVDGSGNIFVTGFSIDCDFPVTAGAFQDPNLNSACAGAFVSEISISALGPAAALAPSKIQFSPQAPRTAAPAQTAVLTNRGNDTLSVSNIAFSGAGFSQTNNCPATLAPAASCTFTVSFTPPAIGNFTGQLTVTNNAVGSPNLVNALGSGGVPAATISTSSLTFSSQVLNSTSAPQSVTLANGGSADLQIASIQATGDFAQTNTCGSTVPAGGNCAVSVTFKPTAVGSRSGSLTITDNASSSPQTVLLGGAGNDFALSATSTAASITAGQTATYALSLAPAGTFTQPITLTCTGAPAASTCSVNPASITPSGTTAVSATVTVATTARAQLLPVTWLPRAIPPAAIWMAAFLVMVLFAMTRTHRALRPGAVLAGIVLVVSLSVISCGGGPGGGGGGGTPPGTYNLTVTATSGNASKTMALSLTVN
jgi:hypothetical protein